MICGKCYVCGQEDNFKKSVSTLGYDYIFCGKCDGGNLVPRKKALREAKKVYNKKYFSWEKPNIVKRTVNSVKLYKGYKEWVGSTRKGKRLLDVGAGVPTYVLEFKEMGYETYASELLNQQGNKIASLIGKDKVFIGDFNKVKIPKNSFDIITLWHVLEHMQEPVETVKKANKLLKKGGNLYLEVPNSNSMTWSIFKDDYENLAVPVHLHYFNLESLTILLNNNGFEVKEVSFPLKYVSLFSLSLAKKYNNSYLYYLTLPVSLLFTYLMLHLQKSEVIRVRAKKL